MLNDLREEAMANMQKQHLLIMADPGASEFVATYRRITGTVDIFMEIPPELSDMKKKHAQMIRAAFLAHIEKLPAYAAWLEAKSIIDAYQDGAKESAPETPALENAASAGEASVLKAGNENSEPEIPGSHEETTQKEAPSGDEDFEMAHGGAWEEDRVQTIVVQEEDPFAFLDEGLKMTVDSAHDSSELMDFEPDPTSVIVSQDKSRFDELSEDMFRQQEADATLRGEVLEAEKHVEENPVIPEEDPQEVFTDSFGVMSAQEKQPDDPGTAPESAEPAPDFPDSAPEPDLPELPDQEFSDEDDDSGSLVTEEGVETYNRITSNIEMEARQAELETSSFVEGIRVGDSGISETEAAGEPFEAPAKMYYEGREVTPEEYRILLEQSAQAQAQAPDAAGAAEDPPLAAQDDFSGHLTDAAEFSEDFLGDGEGLSDRSAGTFSETAINAIFPDGEIPFEGRGASFNGSDDEPEPEVLSGDLPEPDPDFLNQVLSTNQEFREEDDMFRSAPDEEPEKASDSCMKNMDSFDSAFGPDAAKDDVLERTAKANPMREEEAPKEDSAPKEGSKKKRIHSWGFGDMLKAHAPKF